MSVCKAASAPSDVGARFTFGPHLSQPLALQPAASTLAEFH